MFIGTALFSYYKVTGAFLPAGTRPDAVFPFFIMSQLPIGVTGIILAALIAAAISSLDSDLNCLAAIGVEDYYIRLKPKSTDMQRLRVGKIIVAVCGLAAIGVASIYVKTGNKTILGIVFTLYAIFSGGIAGMFLLGLFSKRANKQGLYVGMAACILFTGWAVLTSTPIGFGDEPKLLIDMGRFNFTHHKYMLGVYSHVILFGVGYLASYLFPKPAINTNLTIHGYLKKKKEGEI